MDTVDGLLFHQLHHACAWWHAVQSVVQLFALRTLNILHGHSFLVECKTKLESAHHPLGLTWIKGTLPCMGALLRDFKVYTFTQHVWYVLGDIDPISSTTMFGAVWPGSRNAAHTSTVSSPSSNVYAVWLNPMTATTWKWEELCSSFGKLAQQPRYEYSSKMLVYKCYTITCLVSKQLDLVAIV